MQGDALHKNGKFAIYVLGAGFSAAAGVPMAAELWREILKRGLLIGGRGGKFREDLDAYLEYRRLCDGMELTYEAIDLEELMGFLDIEHHLGLRGKDTWSSDGNEGQMVIKSLIGQILSERTPAAGAVPDLYVDFARRLQPNDIVLTFNYDVLLERALDQAGVPYRLFPYRFKELHAYGGTLDDSRHEVIVLKVHGSVDWFDDRRYLHLRDAFARQGADPDQAHDPVFGKGCPWTLAALVDGPRHNDDPLQHLFLLKEIEAFYEDPPMFTIAPSLISPSTQKLVYSSYVRDFWTGMGDAGWANFRLVVIGYSLPQHDDYARQILYRVARNYQGAGGDLGEALKIDRDPLLLVDRRTDAAGVDEIKRRYAFVDWSKADLYADGFDASVVSRL
ncbi:SIR2 family protein [Phenylobacterium sp.]|uniref:SIR2 family protein n=1 Tax=Phenylobacterium sp. TaxID=1871053 RepID=UPI003BACA9D7